jgi:hypothetical protein
LLLWIANEPASRSGPHPISSERERGIQRERERERRERESVCERERERERERESERVPHARKGGEESGRRRPRFLRITTKSISWKFRSSRREGVLVCPSFPRRIRQTKSLLHALVNEPVTESVPPLILYCEKQGETERDSEGRGWRE